MWLRRSLVASAALLVLAVGVIAAGVVVIGAPRDRDAAVVSTSDDTPGPTTPVFVAVADASFASEIALDAEAETLEIGGFAAGFAAVVFERPEIPARCVRGATLEMYSFGGSTPASEERVELNVYPSFLLGAADYREGDPYPRDETLVDDGPKGETIASTSPGWIRWEVTDLYTTWLRGGPFPSLGQTVSKSAPVVLSVRPPTFADPRSHLALASVESPIHLRPRLRVELRDECARPLPPQSRTSPLEDVPVLVQTLGRSFRIDGGRRLVPPQITAEPGIDARTALAVARERHSSGGATDIVLSFALLDEDQGPRPSPVWVVTYRGVCVPRSGPFGRSSPGCASDEFNVLVDGITGNVRLGFAIGRSVPAYGPRPCSRPKVETVDVAILSPKPGERTRSPVAIHLRTSEGCDATFLISIDGRAYLFEGDPSTPLAPFDPVSGTPLPRANRRHGCFSTAEFWGLVELPPGPHRLHVESVCPQGTAVPATIPRSVKFLVAP